MESRQKFSTIKEQVLRTAEEHRLWSPHDTLVVAVSGGPDSVALLHVLKDISETAVPLNLICAHAHHGLRPEADEEAELVRRLAAELGVRFEMARVDVPSYMKESGKGVEEAARFKRYEFLFETALACGANTIALAHHADDQAETVLMHLLRGSGPGGLRGIRFKRREKNVELIRPFLRIYKTDLVDMCEQNGYPYAVDQTNFQTEYRRNAIRLDVLPYLGQYNSRIVQSINQMADIIGPEDDFVEQAAVNAYRELVQCNHGRHAFRAPSFLALHVALQRRLIKLILNYLSPGSENTDYHKIETIRHGIHQKDSTTWHLDLGCGLVCIREYDWITFMHGMPEKMISYTYRLDAIVPELWLQEIRKVLRMAEHTPEVNQLSKMALDGHQAVFDADELQFPLTIRSRQPGDTMRIMGLNGSKKVKDIFIDAKIPPSMRSRIPVLVDGSGSIVWIPGVRRSIHAAVGAHTSTVLHLSLEDAGNAE
ncbi:tRNA lysidine(34) synthetase TilS [Paenibacillus sp. VMFN-D1]|uniref:tRNA lysidine(34) synthetase TilS n=1 Tax=Paenibacillus sp. VMFN-D1 TaxID=2135608 RepID=UPI000E284CB7|nr:tRNA lysidine(34) synthetase TilS [Paenibacillus sp. VMFN-D1]RED29748.1 tRNA(Ile)-lysidine synthase [Paenibacillus sp. VMFN-D1]